MGKIIKNGITYTGGGGGSEAVSSVNGKIGDVVLNANDVNAIPAEQKGAVNGVAELDSTGKVPSAQLPSYVDDVIEAYRNTTDGKFYEEDTYTTEITPETGKIYVDLSTDTTWRWGGSSYTQISESLALGETSTTAYRGDRGKTAYDHAIDPNMLKSSTLVGLYKVGSTSEGHISELTAVVKKDITDLGIPEKDTTYTESKTEVGSASDWSAGSVASFVYDSSNLSLVITPGAAPSLSIAKASVLTGITAN